MTYEIVKLTEIVNSCLGDVIHQLGKISVSNDNIYETLDVMSKNLASINKMLTILCKDIMEKNVRQDSSR